MRKYIVEFIGTFFLVLTIALAGNPIAIGVALTALVYMGGYISGAHYNPAVTFAILLQNKIQLKEALFYVAFQLLGATFASLLFFALSGRAFLVQPEPSFSFITVFSMELLFTFLLCSVVLHTAVSKKNTPNQFYGLAIGLTVMAGAFSVGPVSGGAFNPAVGVGPIIANLQTGQITDILLYSLGPLTGALLASLFYSFVSGEKK